MTFCSFLGDCWPDDWSVFSQSSPLTPAYAVNEIKLGATKFMQQKYPGYILKFYVYTITTLLKKELTVKLSKFRNNSDFKQCI